MRFTHEKYKRPRQLTTTQKIMNLKNCDQETTQRSYTHLDVGQYQLQKIEKQNVEGLINNYRSTKREFLIELFKEYEAIPFAQSMKNFGTVIKDMYLGEKFPD